MNRTRVADAHDARRWLPFAARRGSLLGLVLAMLWVAWAPVAHAQAPLQPPTWSDEFDGTSLDLTRWSYRGTGPRHDGNLTPDAVSVGDGLLTITTYTDAGKHYSGMISSHEHETGGLEQRYGYFEARMKFDSSPGQWSAFWLHSRTFGNPVGDPATAGVETDIAEHRTRCVAAPFPTLPATCAADNDISDRVQQALIWDGYGADSKSAVRLSDRLAGLGNGSWHTWALRWTPTALTFYYDDVAISSMTGPISRRSQYIILSSEVGRFFAGDIPAAGYGSRATSTTRMQVDWVRVWALPAAPVNTAPPAVSGTAVVGETLTCATGSWSGSPAPAFGYEWLSDGAPISGAAAPTYTIQSGDRGHALSCRVTATNTEGSAGAVSSAVMIPAPEQPPRQAPAPPPPPPVFDSSAPNARLSGRTSQRLGRTVSFAIACPDEACRATGTGSIRVPRIGRVAAKTYRIRPVTWAIAGGTSVTVRLQLTSSARVAIRRALRAGRRITVRVGIQVVDSAGNMRPLTRRVALRL
jgi:beta-glucanase (GH16 family)